MAREPFQRPKVWFHLTPEGLEQLLTTEQPTPARIERLLGYERVTHNRPFVLERLQAALTASAAPATPATPPTSEQPGAG